MLALCYLSSITNGGTVDFFNDLFGNFDLGPMIFVGCIALMILVVIILIIVRITKSSRGKKKLRELQAAGALDMTGKARLAIYSTLDFFDGEPLTAYEQFVARKPSAFMDATVILVAPGLHSFGVHSAATGAQDSIQALLEAGHTYQVGANDDGNYVILDDADYVYKRAIGRKASAAAGALNQ